MKVDIRNISGCFPLNGNNIQYDCRYYLFIETNSATAICKNIVFYLLYYRTYFELDYFLGCIRVKYNLKILSLLRSYITYIFYLLRMGFFPDIFYVWDLQNRNTYRNDLLKFQEVINDMFIFLLNR